MNRFGLFLCALLVGGALTGTSASAHGWYHGGWHHGWRIHSVGGPPRLGPHYWVDTDKDRGYGYFKWCADARPPHHGHHRR